MESSSRIFLCAAAAALVFTGCGPASEAGSPWAEADRIVAGMSKVDFPDRSVSITEYGAVAGDSLNLSGESINLAIVELSRQGGGTVIVPEGTFYTGPITMKSNVNLHVSEGATLKFVPDVSLYMPAVRQGNHRRRRRA